MHPTCQQHNGPLSLSQCLCQSLCFTGHHFPTAYHQTIWIWTEFSSWNKACKYLVFWLSLPWSKRAGYSTRCSGMAAPLHTFLSPQTHWVLRAFTFNLQPISIPFVAMTFSIFCLSSICNILIWSRLSEQWEAEQAVCFQLQHADCHCRVVQKRQTCGWMQIPQRSLTK